MIIKDKYMWRTLFHKGLQLSIAQQEESWIVVYYKNILPNNPP